VAFRSTKRCACSHPKSSAKWEKRCNGHPPDPRGSATKQNAEFIDISKPMAHYWSNCAAVTGRKTRRTMMLNFPNDSRSFDRTRRAVRFWGYDSSMEASFFVTEDALKGLQPNMRVDEEAMLGVFDSNRDRIYAAAAKVYARGRKGSYDLERSDL